MHSTSLIQLHTSVSPARVLLLCFKKLFCSEIKLAISAALESGQNTSVAISILNSRGASPRATEKVVALVTALEIVDFYEKDTIDFFINFCIINDRNGVIILH